MTTEDRIALELLREASRRLSDRPSTSEVAAAEHAIRSLGEHPPGSGSTPEDSPESKRD